MESCQNNAKEIRLGTREYADNLLEKVENYLIEQLKFSKEIARN